MVVGSFSVETQLVVIGDGPAGIAAACRAAELDVETTLVTGARGAASAGARWARAMSFVRAVLDGADADAAAATADARVRSIADRLDALDVRIVSGGGARFDDSRQLSVDGSEEVPRLRFRRAIIATGAPPRENPAGGAAEWADLVTAPVALAARGAALPARAVVYGTGTAPLELARALTHLGARVVLVLGDECLPGDVDDEITRLVRPALDAELEAIHLGSFVADTVRRGGGLEVTLGGGAAGTKPVSCDALVGDEPTRGGVTGLDLSKTRAIAAHGLIEVNEELRTADPRIFAAGGVIGAAAAAEAAAQGRIAGEVAAGVPAAYAPAATPSVVRTDPTIAWCGITPRAAAANGTAHRTHRASDAGADPLAGPVGAWRAAIVVEPESELVLGVVAAGAGAEHAVAEGVLAIEMGAVRTDLAEITHMLGAGPAMIAAAARAAGGRRAVKASARDALSPAAAVRLGAIAIVVLTAIAYLPVLDAGFIWDDDDYLTANAHIQDPGGLPHLWTPGVTHQYYPVVFTMFWIEYRLWGLDPVGYHVVNVLLHIATALLAWRVMARLRIPGAWMIGAVFALHPVHVESVAWIAERKNVLSGVLYLSAAMAYMHFDPRIAGAEAAADASPARRALSYGGAVLLFTAALLAKSVTCSLPAALILVMFLKRAPFTLRRLAPLVPLFAIGLLAAVNTAYLERVSVGASGAAFDTGMLERTLVASRALCFYPGKIVLPASLSFVYERWVIDPMSVWSWWPLVLITIAAGVALAVAWRGQRGPAVALTFYAGTIFPALGFIAVFPHQFSWVADHFVYLASLGIIALVVAPITPRLPSWRIKAAVAVVVLAPLSMLTWNRATAFKSDETLWRDTIAKNDGAWLAHNNLSSSLLARAGAALVEGHREAALDLAVEAEAHADRAVELHPGDPLAHANRSEALRLLGRLEEALDAQTRAVEIIRARAAAAAAPGAAVQLPRALASDLYQLGRLHERLGHHAEAVRAYDEALDVGGENRDALAAAARVLVASDDLDAAASRYERLLATAPNDFTALGTLAAIEQRRGRYERAARLYRAAVPAARTQAEFVQIVTRLIRFLVHCPDETQRNPVEAIGLAERLVDLTSRRDPAALDVLASVYFEAGRLHDAVLTAETAVDTARRLGLDTFAADAAERLEQYRAAIDDDG